MARSRRLSTEIVGLQVFVLVGALLVGFALSLMLLHDNLVHQYEQRVLAVARSVAAEPEIARAVEAGDTSGLVQRRAEAVRRATGALFVVVTDDHGIRYSHPVPSRIGEPVSTDPSGALSGHTVVAIEKGTLGTSARAKVPLRSASGRIVGEVSVGIAADEIRDRLVTLLPSAAAYSVLALAVGVVAALALGRRLKRRTFGLELDEIAALLREREAMLHGVREGVVTFDTAGRVTLLNDEARRLLGVPAAAVGARLEDLLPEGRLRDVLGGEVGGPDEVVLTDHYCLVVNRMPARVGDRDIGAVVTLRDRTEQEGLLRELDSVRGLTDALRAQQHEFSNRLHTVAGLLELGRVDEAREFVSDVVVRNGGFSERLQQQIAEPSLVALLVAKAAVADERGVEIVVAPQTWFDVRLGDCEPLITVLGNLIDNGIDAAAVGPAPRRVTVSLRAEGDAAVVDVHDSGAGVPEELRDRVFTDGFSTKQPAGDRRRGLGLALVRRLVTRLGGSVALTPGPHAHFVVRLPVQPRAEPSVAPGASR